MPFRCSYNSCCKEYSDEYLMERVGTPNDLIRILKSGTCPACGKPDIDLSGLDFDKFVKKPEPEPVKKEVKKPAAKKTTKEAAASKKEE